MLDSEGFSSFSLHAYEPLNEGPGKDCLSGPLSATDLLHCMIGDFETVRRSNVFKGEEGEGGGDEAAEVWNSGLLAVQHTQSQGFKSCRSDWGQAGVRIRRAG